MLKGPIPSLCLVLWSLVRPLSGHEVNTSTGQTGSQTHFLSFCQCGSLKGAFYGVSCLHGLNPFPGHLAGALVIGKAALRHRVNIHLCISQSVWTIAPSPPSAAGISCCQVCDLSGAKKQPHPGPPLLLDALELRLFPPLINRP